MLKSSILKTFNAAINQYLRLDPESIVQLGKLEGKRVDIELKPFNKSIHIEFVDHQLQIISDDDVEPDVILRGSPIRLLAALGSREDRHQFFTEDVEIEGDIELGQQLTDLFDKLDIDWEEHIARFTGDVPAYYVNSFLRKANKWFRDTDESIKTTISDYIHEEAKWMPSKEELNDFFNDIDALRMDTDRVAARIKKLAGIFENEKHK